MPQTAFRYVATRRQRAGLNDDGTPRFWEVGDEVPESEFGSPQALAAALHREVVSKVPIVGDPGEAPLPGRALTGLDSDLAARVAELEAQLADLQAQLGATKPAKSR